jgi:lipoprotein signal peptidase
MKANILLWGVAAGLFALDQITKWLVIAEIPAASR